MLGYLGLGFRVEGLGCKGLQYVSGLGMATRRWSLSCPGLPRFGSTCFAKIWGLGCGSHLWMCKPSSLNRQLHTALHRYMIPNQSGGEVFTASRLDSLMLNQTANILQKLFAKCAGG